MVAKKQRLPEDYLFILMNKMNKYEATIEKLYMSFREFDPDGMASCYHADVEFEDPAFGLLQGQDVMHMWRMLISRAKPDLVIAFNNIEVTDNRGKADWEAIYPFSMTKRMVHNKIHANFIFEGNKIIKHVDTFNLYRWSSMAFGWKGRLLGWTPFFKKKIRETAKTSLERWKEK